jgi:hypothetical protein
MTTDSMHCEIECGKSLSQLSDKPPWGCPQTTNQKSQNWMHVPVVRDNSGATDWENTFALVPLSFRGGLTGLDKGKNHIAERIKVELTIR